MKQKMTALVIDDEENARTLVKTMLVLLDANIEVLGEADSVDEAYDKCVKFNPDVLFLDIELRAGNAFDLLKRLPDYTGKIIFITAYNQYAIQAFRFAALDYLLKPLNFTDLEAALLRLNGPEEPTSDKHMQIELLLQNMMKTTEKRKIAIVTQQNIQVVATKDIIRFESDGVYTWVHTSGGSKVLSTKILKFYDESLTPSGFFRIHSKHLVNLDCVKAYQRGDAGTVVLQNGDELEVSRRKKTSFLERLGSLG